MRTTIRGTRHRAVALLAAAVLGAGLLGGCAEDSDRPGAAGSPGADAGKTTLTVGVFGVFGYKQAGLYDAYMKLHPNIRIKETSIERNENYYPQLLTHLSTGSGLADIQAVEVNNIAEVTATQAGKLVDLSKAPGVRKADFIPWKWAQATDKSGKTVGLGTDIGPMAVCYRKDLFAKAGLPTDRNAVAALWAGDWGKYLDVGERYKAKAPAGTAFVDSASGVYNAVISSSAERYYDRDGKLVYKDSPSVRQAWDAAMRAATGKLTARLQQFQKSWDQAYANGRFATVSCPPWMLGYIKEKSGDQGRDVWDVAAAPKPGNWGGSFLAVPEAGRHKSEAVKLAAWLTAPEQQAKLFTKQASFPSARAAYGLPAVAGAKHPYFGDAPIGKIFAAAAEGIPNQVLGPKDLTVNQNITDVGVLQVDQQGKTPEQGWRAAVESIDNALDQ
ncbi:MULTISPECIES: ABC transporter substrate-binding protein [Streptomyces]|uniref:Carbohydrate ABC transporter substrate-binding protein n=2 Tax=Streptomyces rimosus subsp. rimosus TaxID=132474 RepID=L8EN51_STRR1|nr:MULTISPECIES: ABC transporter substrate-binding protein [Streptomyces]KOG72091.1 sugar-binding protein [Kitasatospora aureofaciens]MYT44222.1 extracellular solute-binding protein [Streptomyces sp. SID5471]KEF03912.1 sugar-binding protein [Streptomyces rimosus]KOT36075.1 sugar-binding protein [Streptomyces sp. NRRL WC-3701]KOT36518.1 sugar-binding protein [Streptomyces rimosus subsp. rimosus]